MREIYDVLVDFKKYPYEFYEWDKTDDIINIKVIPSFKVSYDCLRDFLFYDVKIKNSFLKKIENKTEVFFNRMIKKIKYACIIFNEDVALALEFNDEGNVIGKSRLLFDEEDDVIDKGFDLEESTIPYNTSALNKYKNYNTRNEQQIINIINKYLDIIYDNNKTDEIKYVYYECFSKKEENVKKAYQKLKESIESENVNIINRIKELLKVLKK